VSRDTFFSWIDPMRDPFAWERTSGGRWIRRHELAVDSGTDARDQARDERHIFSDQNQRLYFNSDRPPQQSGEAALDAPARLPLAR
jgi:hypothetical protein